MPEPITPADPANASAVAYIAPEFRPVTSGAANFPPRWGALKRIGFAALQVLVTVAGMGFVFHDPRTREEVGEALQKADVRWLVLGWFVYGAVEIIATVRWQILLRIQGIFLGWWRTCGIVMLGLFCNLFLPGLIGGDAVRLYFVFKRSPHRKARAVLTVAADRMFGLLSLLCLAALSLGLRFDWLRQSSITANIIWITIVMLSAALVFVAFLFACAGFNLLDRLPNRFPFRSGIMESGEALRLYRRHFPAMMAAFLLTLCSHFAYYICFYCSGRSLSDSANPTVSLGDVLTIMPIVNTLTAAPISLGGVGVRETLFQELLGRLAHVPPVVAALTASLGFALQASWGALGAGCQLWMQRSDANEAPIEPRW